MARTLHHHATVHLDSLPIDPAVIISQQGSDRGSNVVGAGHSTESCVFGDSFVYLGIVAHDTSAKVRCNRTRRDDIDRDAARA